MKMLCLGLGLLTLLLGGPARATEGVTTTTQPTQAVYLTRKGAELFMGERPFRAVGVNKFDLFLQYLQGGAEREQAARAIRQAAQNGLRVIRFTAVGFYPKNMERWSTDAYWRAMDDLVAEARQNGVGLIPTVDWNIYLFPDMAGETVQDLLTNADSKSRQYLDLYVSQIVTRYRNEPAVLFWEITNELDLGADLAFMRPYGFAELNAVEQGAAPMRVRRDNYTTAQMIGHIGEIASLIRKLDPNHLIGAGYCLPRSAAQHLRTTPGDWTADTPADLETYLRDINPNPVDLISIHFYNLNKENQIFGNTDPNSAEPLKAIKQACDRIGKPVYLGETGQFWLTGEEGTPLVDPVFVRNVLNVVAESQYPITLLWQWESPKPAHLNITANGTPEVVRMMRETQAQLESKAGVQGR